MPEAQFRILMDVPLKEHLALGFNELATAFGSVIETSPAQFAIGLFGGWGSGKTTLMEAIAGGLNHQNCAVVWFSAWRYEKEQHLIVPLLDVVREGLMDWHDSNTGVAADVRDTAMKVAATVGKAIASLLAGLSLKVGVPGGPEISYDANKAISRANKFDEAEMAARVPRSFYHASFKALKDAFKEFVGPKGERRIVVFVDDLDRCLPDGALEVLEAMKLFFDIPGFIFVVGLDLRIVEVSIERRYRDVLTVKPGEESAKADAVISGAMYIRKIFQVPYTLSPVAPSQIGDFLRSIQLTGGLPADQWGEIDVQVRPHLSFLADASGINPREVKRYINAYTLVRKIKPHLDKNIVLALQTLAFRPDWRLIQFALLAFREAFIEALVQQVQAPANGYLEALAPNLASLPQSFSTYLEVGQPGNVLISNPFMLADYLFVGVSTATTVDSQVIELFREVGGLLATARGAFPNANFAILKASMEAISSRVTSTASAGFRATRVGEELGDAIALLGTPEILEAVRISQPVSPAETPMPLDAVRQAREQLRTTETQVIAHIRQAIVQLQEIYYAGIG